MLRRDITQTAFCNTIPMPADAHGIAAALQSTMEEASRAIPNGRITSHNLLVLEAAAPMEKLLMITLIVETSSIGM